jgi:hypothetical protein
MGRALASGHFLLAKPTAYPALAQKLFSKAGVSTPLTFYALFDFIHQLFRPKAKAPATWHAVALSPGQAQRHARWVEQRVYLNWLGPYFKAYHLRKGGAAGSRGLQVQLLQEPGRQGALFFFDPTIGPGNFRHFYEHLGERVQALGYHRACADRRARQHQGRTETTLKQLFKPNPTDCPQTGHCNQRFGLITVDLVSVDGHPMFIRLTSNAVLEPGFTPARTFDDLLQALLDAPPADAATQALVPKYHGIF